MQQHLTFAVLNATVLQSGSMLIDHAGSTYIKFRNLTVTSDKASMFERNAAQSPL